MILKEHRHFKKAVIIFAIVMVVFSCLSPAIAYAEDLSIYDKTFVLDDLKNATIGSKPFDEKNYPVNTYKDLEILQVVEYCYSEYNDSNQFYGIYFYLYNPKAIDYIVYNNTVSMATVYSVGGKPIGYENLEIKYLNKTTDNRFYKFRLVDSRRFLNIVNSGRRIYDVAGIQLKKLDKDRNPEIVDYKIGASYEYSGFAQGCAANKDEQSTLTSKVNNLETIEIKELFDITYRTGVSDKGANWQNQVDSVVFSIPKKFQKNYGSLQKIEAEWYEYRTQPMLVIEDKKWYEWFAAQIGDEKYGRVGVGAVAGLKTAILGNDDWRYNYPSIADSEVYSSVLWSVFHTNGKSYKDFILTSDALKPYFRGYNHSKAQNFIEINGRQICFDPISFPVTGTHFDGTPKTGGRTRVNIDARNTFDLLGLSSKYDGDIKKAKFKEFGLFYRFTGTPSSLEYKDVIPIKPLSAKDFTNSNTEVSKTLLVPEEKISWLTSYEAKNEFLGNDTFIFRFAASDYYNSRATLYSNDTFVLDNNKSYMAQQNIYLDFDILSLTFNKEGEYMTIPVVASPIDIVGSITPPARNEGGFLGWLSDAGKDALNILKYIVIGVIVILVVILLVLCFPIIKWVCSIIWSGIKATGRGVKKIFSGGKAE